MASFANLLLPLLLLATLSPKHTLCYINPGRNGIVQQDGTETPSTYIVLVKPPQPSADGAGGDAHHRWHESFLPTSRRLVHSYTEALSGFAARLIDAELREVAKKPGFVRSFPDRRLQLTTTHTPEFLGLTDGTGFWSGAGYGRGVIVGLLDSGIHAAHPSFDDRGIPPPPAKWKGSCDGGSRCNNKLIGVKSFLRGDDGSAGDPIGHGTHTASTAAGSFVGGASAHGLGAGTAAGIAAGAHVAMYKVCGGVDCSESTFLAGLDEAIRDGADVLSISLGGRTPVRFDLDAIAIGAFSAVAKGITVVCAGGNAGPAASSVVNDAPWLLTVGAGSVDRSFQAEVRLGDGKTVDGQAFPQVANNLSSSKSYPLVYSNNNSSSYAGGVDGKIVVLEYEYDAFRATLKAGAAGVVLINDAAQGYTTVVRDYNASGVDVVQVTPADGSAITDYATSSSRDSPAATITYNNTLLGVRPSPVVAYFSGRGPSANSPGVLKPDVLAPGLNIIAAVPPHSALGVGPFNVMSGTSMATPHISGVAALIRSSHPDWSPAAIKSAILTTADAVDRTGGAILDEQHREATAYATGAGHVSPARAADPGLVYDLGASDYDGYICWLLGDDGLATIVRNSSSTCADLPEISDAQLNYPTVTVPLRSEPFAVNRTVTNVGPAKSTYKAELEVPESLTVRVTPDVLLFSRTGENKVFTVSVSGRLGGEELFLQGSLRWVSEKHVVRSPIIAVPASDSE